MSKQGHTWFFVKISNKYAPLWALRLNNLLSQLQLITNKLIDLLVFKISIQNSYYYSKYYDFYYTMIQQQQTKNNVRNYTFQLKPTYVQIAHQKFVNFLIC